MSFTNIPLVSWGNGTIMIGVFAIVVVILISVVYALINSDKNSK